jgi:malonyl-CoA/methylmalonyl-CoA synthetase
LLRHARRGRVAVKDAPSGFTVTYGGLLDAVLSFREVVLGSIPAEAVERLHDGREVYIGVLAAGGYEFAVAVLAVLALGAAVVPMCMSSSVLPHHKH